MTTVAEPMPAGELTSAETASARVEERVQGLGRRSIEPDKWMLIGGAVVTPLGLILVILGWLGAARTPLLFEQIPYLISGGLLGLGLVFAGGFAYFAYWHTVSIREARSQHSELLTALTRVEGLLADAMDWPDEPAPAKTQSSSRRSKGRAGTYRATANGSLFHRAECTVVTGRSGLREVDGTERDLRPCRICNPLSTD